MHERDRFALGKISPPTGGNRPETKADLADCQIGILVSAKLHKPKINHRGPEVTERIWTFLLCALRVLCGKIVGVERKPDAALLIVAHGSTVNPDSSAPTLAHAAEIRRRKVFAEVECAFWKEEPSLRDALFLFDPESIREVYVVPNFISEGYFTQTVVPRELELDGPITTRSNGQIWRYCEPVGNHSLMTELLLKRARDVAPDAAPGETSLLIVAHGTDLNENSAVAAKREAEKIRALGKYAAVLNVYMEEAPLVSDWRKLTKTAKRGCGAIFYF